MVLRAIFRYLVNNEQLIQRLSESYPMRRTAQIFISAYYRSRAIAEEQKLVEMTPESFKRMIQNFKNSIKQEVKTTTNNMKKPK
ncbi:protein NCBP2AS2 homolog [Wyeomyia smithii]|uniref:protein NCBP2AS2 homolog n=1 Tax=Wyeomyia smithii TaxID=174621 RepID=UPI002467FC75|nr:protein NCBP2AS2 homolog [Wyeomyia smithii]